MYLPNLALAAAVLLPHPTAAQDQRDIAYPLDGWPPSRSYYSWAITNWKMGHVIHGGPFGYVSSSTLPHLSHIAFNITGPTVTAPQPDPSAPPPTVVVPGFRASCQYDDRGNDPHLWRPCVVDMDFAPTPPWKQTASVWRLAVAMTAGAPGGGTEPSTRLASVSVVFWSEYANQTWNMTAYFRPQWKSTSGWKWGSVGWPGFAAFPEKVEQVLG